MGPARHDEQTKGCDMLIDTNHTRTGSDLEYLGDAINDDLDRTIKPLVA